MTTGERIKQLREKLDYTQEYIAAEIGVAPQTIFKYESGLVTNIPLDKVEKLAKILKTSPASLVGWNENPNIDVDFYRILLSGNGIKAIRRQLKPIIDAYGIEQLAEDIYVDWADIQQFFSSDLQLGTIVEQRLYETLISLNTNLYELFNNDFSENSITSETAALYASLDKIDKAEIKGEIKQMLKAEKYAKVVAPEKKVSLADMGTIAARSGKSNKPKTKSAKIIK